MGIFDRFFNGTVSEMTSDGTEGKRRDEMPYGAQLYTPFQPPTVDYRRNNYDLFRAIYHGSRYNGEGEDYLMSASLAKPIINSSAAFALGTGFDTEITVVGQEEQSPQVEKAQDAVNKWLKQNKNEIFDVYRHSLRDGDSYAYVNETGQLDEFDAKNVTVVLDDTTGDVIGYDVEEVYEKYKEKQEGRTETYRIVKKYRKDGIEYLRYDKTGQTEKGKTVYKALFTEDEGLVVIDNPDQQTDTPDFTLTQRALPVIHFANEREPRAIYGNSEFQNLLVSMQWYHKAMTQAGYGVMYNSTPIFALKNVTDISKTVKQSNSNTDDDDKRKTSKRLTWGQNKILYLNGDNADAKFIQTDDFMNDVAKFLELQFYLILEGSETPEFVFGAAVQSSKASTETQVPVMLQKAERKRTQLDRPLQNLIRAYIDRRIYLGDATFLPLDGKQIEITLSFPDLVSEDRKLTLDIIKYLHDSGMVTDKTTLEQLMGAKIADPEQEITEAREETEATNEQNRLYDEEAARLKAELDASVRTAQPPTKPKNEPVEDE